MSNQGWQTVLRTYLIVTNGLPLCVNHQTTQTCVGDFKQRQGFQASECLPRATKKEYGLTGEKRVSKECGSYAVASDHAVFPAAVITCDFNKHINPKIIQRKARHSKIETTLQYDHVSDDMVREYFTNFANNIK